MKKSLPALLLVLVAALIVFLWQSSGSGQGESGEDPVSTARPAPALQGRPSAEPTPAEALPGAVPGGRTDLPGGRSTPVAPAAGLGTVLLRLADAREKPVADAEAELFYRRDFGMPQGMMMHGSQPMAPSLRKTPDRAGLLRITGITPGRPLEIELAGSRWLRRTVWVAPLDPGEVRDLGVIALAPGNTLRGRVLDPDGRPLAGAEAGLVSGGAGGPGLRVQILGQSNEVRDFEARTGEDGRFEIHGVQPGTYTLYAKAPGLLEQRQPGFEIEERAGTQEVTLRLGAGAALAGRVLDADGRPVAGARVAGVAAQGFGMMSWDRERLLREGVETGKDGRFVLDGLRPAEQIRVAAAAPRFGRTLSGRVRPGDEVQIVLAPAVTVRGRVHTPQGRGIPEAMLRCSLAGQAGRMGMGMGMEMPGFERSDENGEFEFQDLKAGDYEITVTSWAGEEQVFAPVAVRPGMEPLDFTIAGENPVLVRLVDQEQQPLAGVRVTMRPQKPPAALPLGMGRMRIEMSEGGEMISLGDAQVSARTNELGEARFYSLDAGNWSISARPESYAPVQATLERPVEAEQEVEIEVLAAGSLRVTVVDDAGGAVPRAAVGLAAVSGQEFRGPSPRLADDQGIVVWQDLAPGDYAVYPEKQGSGGSWSFGDDVSIEIGGEEEESGTPSNAVPVEVAGGRRADLQLFLAAKALLRVQVMRLGEPVADAQVSLQEQGGNEEAGISFGNQGPSARTGLDGWAQLPPADPGDYVLSIRPSPQNPPTDKEIALFSGRQEQRVELPSGVVAGQVFGLGGPLAGAKVKLVPARAESEGRPARGQVVMISAVSAAGSEPVVESFSFNRGEASVTTGPDGSYQFTDVPAGRYQVEVVAKGYGKHESEAFEHDGKARHEPSVANLVAAGALEGRILGARDEPDEMGLSFQIVTLVSEEGERVGTTAAGADGRYAFRDLKPGTYRLQVSGPGGDATESGPVAVRAGPPTVFDFTLP